MRSANLATLPRGHTFSIERWWTSEASCRNGGPSPGTAQEGVPHGCFAAGPGVQRKAGSRTRWTFWRHLCCVCAWVGTKAGSEWASCPERGTACVLSPPFPKPSLTLFYGLNNNRVHWHARPGTQSAQFFLFWRAIRLFYQISSLLKLWTGDF